MSAQRIDTPGNISSSLIDWYKFDDNGGSYPSNAGTSGIQLNFSLATWVVGHVGGGALSFGGGNVARSTDSDGGSCSLLGDTTISIWYNKSAGVNSGARLASWVDTANSLYTMFVLDTSGTNVAVVSADGSSYSAIDSANAWHHVVGLFTNGLCVEAYLDNVLMTTHAGGTYWDFGYAGGRAIGGTNVQGFTMTGIVDDARRYTRLLTSTDRTKLYAAR